MEKATFLKLLNNIYKTLTKARPTKFKRKYRGKKGQWVYEYAKPGEKIKKTALSEKDKIKKQYDSAVQWSKNMKEKINALSSQEEKKSLQSFLNDFDASVGANNFKDAKKIAKNIEKTLNEVKEKKQKPSTFDPSDLESYNKDAESYDIEFLQTASDEISIIDLESEEVKHKKKISNKEELDKVINHELISGEIDLLLSEENVPESDKESITSFMETNNFRAEDVSDISKEDNGYNIEIDGEEWFASDDDGAYEEAREKLESLIDDIGITSFTIWKDHIDKKKLGRDLAMDSNVEYDLGYDEPDRFIDEEPSDDGDWSDKQREKAGNKAAMEFEKRVKDDPTGYLEEIYGEISEFPNLEDYVDTESLIDEAIRLDGEAHTIATYDGDSKKYGNLNFYRLN